MKALEYDPAGRITKLTGPDGTTDYFYDVRDQLLAANYSAAGDADEAYALDANGNRLSETLPPLYHTAPIMRDRLVV